MANRGRDTARAYSAFLKSQEKLVDEINTALEAGAKPIQIAHDVMGRCSTRESMIDLLSVLVALARMDKIPESVVNEFDKGLRPKRV